jgi:hypothetical protein
MTYAPKTAECFFVFFALIKPEKMTEILMKLIENFAGIRLL